jgi:hypothetical protein
MTSDSPATAAPPIADASQTDDYLSPEAAAYLEDLRTLPFEEFRRKHAIDANANATRAASARRRERGASKDEDRE